MNAAKGGKHVLIQGMFFILVGLLWGLVVPHTPFPRLALSAHIQFEGSGVMFIVIGILLLALPHRVGGKSIWMIMLSVWLTWIMVLSEVANSWWGTNQILPIAAHEAGATGGAPWQETIVTLAHVIAGIALIIAWILLIVGFAKMPPDASQTAPPAGPAGKS
jgi:hydroxylaminobenzene mutase